MLFEWNARRRQRFSDSSDALWSWLPVYMSLCTMWNRQHSNQQKTPSADSSQRRLVSALLEVGKTGLFRYRCQTNSPDFTWARELFKIEHSFAWVVGHDLFVMKKERGPKKVLAIRCPTCGAAPGEKCELSTGQPRPEPHQERQLIALG